MKEKEVAIGAAKKAGELIFKYYSKQLEIKSKNKQHFNLVTNIDVKSEKLIISEIKKVFPDHSFFAEEGGKKLTSSDYLWIIDPIDGTNNFAHKIPFFCVSIALYKKNKPLLGVVYEPMRKELFYAEKGRGASLNGKRIRVSKKKKLHDSFLVFGIYYERGKGLRKILDHYYEFLDKGALDVRRMGSAALELCYVSCGRFDGYWEPVLSPWDFAAGSLILQEAGGVVTDMQGKTLGLKKNSILGSNGKIHKEMLTILKK